MLKEEKSKESPLNDCKISFLHVAIIWFDEKSYKFIFFAGSLTFIPFFSIGNSIMKLLRYNILRSVADRLVQTLPESRCLHKRSSINQVVKFLGIFDILPSVIFNYVIKWLFG